MRVVKSKPFAVEVVLASAYPDDLGTLDRMLGGSAWKTRTAGCTSVAVRVRLGITRISEIFRGSQEKGMTIVGHHGSTEPFQRLVAGRHG